MQTRTFKEYKAEWFYHEIKDASENIEVKFYKDNVYQYSKMKNNYHTEHDKFMLLEFFEINNKNVFIFNDKHGCISVFDCETSILIHQTKNNDVFIYNYEMFDKNEYLYISGWVWSPIGTRSIYHVPSMLTIRDYEDIHIPTSDCDDAYVQPSISLFGCATCNEFLSKKDDIFERISHEYEVKIFNQQRLKPNILLNQFLLQSSHVIFTETSNILLKNIIATNRSKFFIKTIGGITGEHLSNYDFALLNVCGNKILDQYDELSFLIAMTLFERLEKLPFPRIHLIFELYTDLGNLKFIVKHELLQTIEDKITYNHINPLVQINIECICF